VRGVGEVVVVDACAGGIPGLRVGCLGRREGPNRRRVEARRMVKRRRRVWRMFLVREACFWCLVLMVVELRRNRLDDLPTLMLILILVLVLALILMIVGDMELLEEDIDDVKAVEVAVGLTNASVPLMADNDRKDTARTNMVSVVEDLR